MNFGDDKIMNTIVDEKIIEEFIKAVTSTTCKYGIKWESNEDYNHEKRSYISDVNEWYRSPLDDDSYVYLLCFADRNLYELYIQKDDDEPTLIIDSENNKKFSSSLKNLYDAITATSSGIVLDKNIFDVIETFLSKIGCKINSIK